MLTPSTDFHARALGELDRASSGDGAPLPLADVRRRGRDAFAALGLPTRRDEAWKYTDLRPALAPDYAFASPGAAALAERALTESDLDAYAIPELGAARVVLVNGAFAPALSDLAGWERATVGSLRDALARGDEAARFHFARLAAPDADAFLGLSAGADVDGLFLNVPDRAVVERPLHVVHVVDADAPAFVQTRALLLFGEGSQARVVETMHVRGEAATFGNHVTEVVVGARAVVDHARLQDEGPQASQVNATHVEQADGSVFTTATFTFASALVRNNVTAVPLGTGCETNLYGLYVIEGAQHVDNHTLIDHAAPGCQSNELYKGIVYDEATGVFNGKVMVRREGQQTNAYQQSQGVVLSDRARHYAKPELEIYADDVKCSHGSTTGEIDPEALYYCRARGIAFEDARAMLLYAFAHDIVEQVRPEPLRTFLDGLIERRLK